MQFRWLNVGFVVLFIMSASVAHACHFNSFNVTPVDATTVRTTGNIDDDARGVCSTTFVIELDPGANGYGGQISGGTCSLSGCTFDTIIDIACLSAGAHILRARINDYQSALYSTSDGSFQADNAPKLDNAAMFRWTIGGTRGVQLRFDYDMRHGTAFRIGRVERLAWRGLDGVLHPGEVLEQFPLDEKGSFIKAYYLGVGAKQALLRIKLSSCAGETSQIVAVDCFDCDKGAASADPVGFVDGSVQVSDADPLPPIGGISLNRSYDADEQDTALFGRGWTSIFDRHLTSLVVDGKPLAFVSTERNGLFIFEVSAGTYTQIWPVAQRGDDVGYLHDGIQAGTYEFRQGGSQRIDIFDGTGALLGVRDLSTGRKAQFTYDADGVPITMADSWNGLTWQFTRDPNQRSIATISVVGEPAMVWIYTYDGNHNLTAVHGPANTLWRTYDYSANRLTDSHDGDGNLIESHTYGADLYAASSTGPTDEIQSIRYNANGVSAAELVTRVTYKTGAITEYTFKPFPGAYRAVRIKGTCSSCGGEDQTFVRNANGQIIREQGADGYVTARTYSGPYLISEQYPLRPADCDPATDAAVCRLESTELATANLVSTAQTISTVYERTDPAWPERVTAIQVPTVFGAAGASRRDTYVYEAVSGQIKTEKRSGWTVGSTGVPVQLDRATTTSYYGNAAPAPAFTPGGNFLGAWLALPQPEFLKRSIDGPRTDVSDVTSFVYYPIDASVTDRLRGRLAAMKNPSGHITHYEDYDVFGNPTRVVDSNGVRTDMTYDPFGRLSRTTLKAVTNCDTSLDPLCSTDIVTARTFTGAGRVASESRPRGGTTAYTYDGRGRIASVSRGPSLTDLRERIEYAYDPSTGKQSVVKDLAFENNVWVEKKREVSNYDTLARLVTLTHLDGTSNGYAYNLAGRLAGVRDEAHTQPNTQYTYDPSGRLSRVSQTLAGSPGGVVTTTYSYDKHGNLSTVEDPNTNLTSYVYDDFGQMLSQASPINGMTAYRYDTAGNLLSITDANGATTTRSYDALGRVQSATAVHNSTSEEVTWSYDDPTAGMNAIGRPVTMTDPSGSTNYAYDRRGLLRAEIKSISGGVYSTGYEYDADGNRNAVHYPSGHVASFTFDYAGRPLTASFGTTSLVSATQYAPFGPPTLMTFGNGTARDVTLDSRYRVTQNDLTSGAISLASYQYGYTADGNVLSIHDLTDAAFNRDFSYDDLDRVTSSTGGSSLWPATSYSYDAMGNLLSVQPQNGGASPLNRTFTYAGVTPRLRTVIDTASRSITYDGAGNETVIGAQVYSYNPRNQLTTAGPMSYQYDGHGLRVATAILADQCTPSVTPGRISSSARGTTGVIEIATLPDCDWTVSGNPSWMSIGAITSGRGSSVIPYTIESNPNSSLRSASLTIGGASVPISQLGTTATAQFADFTGDAVSDILLREDTNGSVRVYRVDGARILETIEPLAEPDLFWKITGSADFDADGKTDLVWRHARTGEIQVRYMNGGILLRTATVATGDTYQKVAGCGDLDGNGRAEILTRNESTGQVYEWSSVGDTWTGQLAHTEPDRQWQIAAVADFTADGRADLLWRHLRNGQVHIQTRASATAFGGGTLVFTDTDSSWQVVGAADIDGDAHTDVVSYRRGVGTVRVHYLSGTAVASTATVMTEPDLNWRIVQLGDFDGDGKFDLLWRHVRTGALRIDRMVSTTIRSSDVFSGQDAFWRVASAVTSTAAQAQARTDFNGDGKSDILWRASASPGQVAMWLMNERVILNTGSTVIMDVADMGWKIKAAADYNSDGKCDIIWAHDTTRALAMWEMNGTQYLDVRSFATLDPNWQLQGAGYFDSDRNADLFLLNTATGEFAIWEMQGRTALVKFTFAVTNDLGWKVAGIADFDGDGKSDVLWRHNNGHLGMTRLDGHTIVANGSGEFASVEDSAMRIERTGDFTGDGRADILWRNTSTGVLWLWEMNGMAKVSEVMLGVKVTDPQWKIQATGGDYNGDGREDILWRNASTGAVAMWRMRGTTLVDGSTFWNVPTTWAIQSTEPGAVSLYGSNALLSVQWSSGLDGQPWWSPIHGRPPFWHAAKPGPPYWTPAGPNTPFLWSPPTSMTPPPTTPVEAPPFWLPVDPESVAVNMDVSSDDPHRDEAVSSTARVETATMPSVRTSFSFYSPDLQLLAQTGFSSTPPDKTTGYEYVWFNGLPLAQVETSTSAIHYYFNDHLGTPILTTNATGQIDWQIEREPYGKLYLTRTGLTRYQPLAFPGQESDGGEMAYNIFRWYRSGWGRYTQADPIGLDGGINLYQYALSNPATWTDRYGLTTSDCQEHAERCRRIEEQIKQVSKKLKRLLDNERDPTSYARSAFDYWRRYDGHLEQYANRQRELNRLRQRWIDERCDGDPPNYFGVAGQPYPDFDWDEFRRLWRDGMNRSMDDINDIMNDPRTWLGLAAGAAGAGGRVPVRAFP